MNIREDLLISAVDEYIDDVFNGFSYNVINVCNKIGAKIMLKNFIKKFGSFVEENGMFNIDNLEEIIMPEVRKLGIIEIPAIGTKYTFNENDFIKLFAKMKGKANE